MDYVHQVVKDASKEIVQTAVRENPSLDIAAIHSGLQVAAATTAVIPAVGPIISAIMAAVAAEILLIQSIGKKSTEDEAAKKEGATNSDFNAKKTDHHFPTS
jgi:hypothetical protein